MVKLRPVGGKLRSAAKIISRARKIERHDGTVDLFLWHRDFCGQHRGAPRWAPGPPVRWRDVRF
jgi:hypothetical protein